MRLGKGLERLKEILGGMEGVLVAYSGGVDSTLLLQVASQVCGSRVLAVTVASPLHPEEEVLHARKMAESLGVRHRTVEIDLLSDPQVASNPRDRCYWCKGLIFRGLLKMAFEEGLPNVVDGSNADDLRDYRPGLKALRELGVRSPLAEAGLGKAAIRALSRELGLPTWDRPSQSCMATRIPTGTPLDPALVERIRRAERSLLALGVRQVRVRHEGEGARIEVFPEDMEALLRHRLEALEALKGLGYKRITVDLEGYREGPK